MEPSSIALTSCCSSRLSVIARRKPRRSVVVFVPGARVDEGGVLLEFHQLVLLAGGVPGGERNRQERLAQLGVFHLDSRQVHERPGLAQCVPDGVRRGASTLGSIEHETGGVI